MQNIRAEINSVRYDVSEKDNYLKNASFVYDMTYWEHSTAVNVYSASGEMVNVNANLYSEKSNVSDIVLYNNQYMLRVKSSGVKQLNKDLNHKPDKVEKFLAGGPRSDRRGAGLDTGSERCPIRLAGVWLCRDLQRIVRFKISQYACPRRILLIKECDDLLSHHSQFF